MIPLILKWLRSSWTPIEEETWKTTWFKEQVKDAIVAPNAKLKEAATVFASKEVFYLSLILFI
jgi:hypothetical protein